MASVTVRGLGAFVFAVAVVVSGVTVAVSGFADPAAGSSVGTGTDGETATAGNGTGTGADRVAERDAGAPGTGADVVEETVTRADWGDDRSVEQPVERVRPSTGLASRNERTVAESPDGSAAASSTWWDDDWEHRRRLTITEQSGTELVRYPVVAGPVDIGDASPASIRVVDESTGEVLPFAVRSVAGGYELAFKVSPPRRTARERSRRRRLPSRS